MMDDGYIALIEMLFSFGVVLIWGVYQLWSVRRVQPKRRRTDDESHK